MNHEDKIECHCCTSNKKVKQCSLENCDYPLCSSCKKKVYNLDTKCPNCRREIIDIESGSENNTIENNTIESETIENETIENEPVHREYPPRFPRIWDVLFILVCAWISLLWGRYIWRILYTNPKVDFWCSELKLSAIYFIGTGFLGLVLFGICTICGISLINICCCGEHVGARARLVHDEE